MTLIFLMCIWRVIKQYLVSFTSMMVICIKKANCVCQIVQCVNYWCLRHMVGINGTLGCQENIRNFT
jgi:hypothetical protein